MATAPESEMDITSLLQPRQGYLWKLGGGQEKGSKWNRRWCVFTARTPAGLLRESARCEAPAVLRRLTAALRARQVRPARQRPHVLQLSKGLHGLP